MDTGPLKVWSQKPVDVRRPRAFEGAQQGMAVCRLAIGFSRVLTSFLGKRNKFRHVFSIKIKRFYLLMREREAETQAEEAGSMQRAQCGTRPRVPRIMPWAEGGTKPQNHPMGSF